MAGLNTVVHDEHEALTLLHITLAGAKVQPDARCTEFSNGDVIKVFYM